MPGAWADYETGAAAWEEGRHTEAKEEWLAASEAGDPRAMLALGRLYVAGMGAPQDYVEAHKWFNLAAGFGESEAVAERDALAQEMTVEERAEARKLARETPIDGVGLQFHLEVGLDNPSVGSILDNLARYHSLGLSTHITELDVRIRGPLTAEKLREQARLYETVFRAALQSPSTDDVMLWGFTDRFSWITSSDGFFPQHVAGTVMDEDLGGYPSFQAIRSVLTEARQSMTK